MKSKFVKGFLTAVFLITGVGITTANADVRIDVTNENSEECSVAFNARTDKTKWVTTGWYVFMSGETAPVILKGVNDVKDVYIYHDCGLKPTKDDEVKRGWIKVNLKFTDYIPKEKEEGYDEVTFVRLTGPSYVIQGDNSVQ